MLNFEFNTPTKVVFGKGAESRVGELVKGYACKKVLIHYGGGSAVRSGLIDRIKASLDAAEVAYVTLGGVVANPRLSKVYEGMELCKKEGVDFILAVGGGSVIDSSKAIAYGLANDCDPWIFYEHVAQATTFMPVGAVLTIAAAGSEMSNSSVITKDEGMVKRGYNNEISRPKFAIMNPELTMTLPAYQTASGAADILMHTMERYLTNDGFMELTDAIAEGLMKTVMKNAQILVDDPMNYEARAELMWASSLSHNGLTGCGTDGGDWASHMIEHELGGMFDVAHGAGLAAVWPSWARYVLKDCTHRLYKFATNVLDVEDTGNEEEVAIKGIEKMEEFYHSINMPANLKELGIEPTDEQMHTMARMCIAAAGGKAGKAKPLYEEDVYNIYKMANK